MLIWKAQTMVLLYRGDQDNHLLNVPMEVTILSIRVIRQHCIQKEEVGLKKLVAEQTIVIKRVTRTKF